MRKVFNAAILCLVLFSVSCEKTSTEDPQKISIGALISLTGNWSSLGITSKAAIEIAVADVNAYVRNGASQFEFVHVVYDTKLDTALAVQFISQGYASGVRYFVGPQSSAELAAVRGFSNGKELMIISQGSTAGSLAIADDAIYRFCPGDSIEGGAVASSVYALGYQYLITASRNDAGNLGLQRAVGQKFASLGGTTETLSPYAVNQADFSAFLAVLKVKIQAGISLYGASKVGVYLASFDECVQLFQQASSDPVFASVRWFGGDGVVLSSALVGDPQAAAFAAATQFFAPNFGLPVSPHPDAGRVVASIRTSTNLEPDAYALAAYDAVWVIAQTLMGLSDAQPGFQDFLSGFKVQSKFYYGLTGPLQLNAAGDRSNGTFDYWGVVRENGVYQWKLVGKSF